MRPSIQRFLAALIAIALANLAWSMPAQAEGGTQGTGSVSEQRMAERPEIAFERAFNDISRKTRAMSQTWWGDGGNWAVDLERGEIEFTNDRGWLITAPVQVVGTYVPSKGTFMWGWDHPSVPNNAALSLDVPRPSSSR